MDSSGEGWVRRCLDAGWLLCLWSGGKLNQSPSPPESGHMAPLGAQRSATLATLLASQSVPKNRWLPANENKCQPSYKKSEYTNQFQPKFANFSFPTHYSAIMAMEAASPVISFISVVNLPVNRGRVSARCY